MREITLTAVALLSLTCMSSSLHHHHRRIRDRAQVSIAGSDGGSWSYAESSSNGDPVAYGGIFGSSNSWDCSTSSSSSGSPCAGRRRQGSNQPRYRTVYQDIDGKCVATQVQEEDRQQQACNCVSSDSCATVDVEVDQPYGGPAIAVSVGSSNIYRSKRSIAAIIDSMLGGHYQRTGNGNQQVYVPGILDMIPGIDVRVGNGHPYANAGPNRGISVNVGSPGGVRVAIGGGGNRIRPFGVVGTRIDESGNTCSTCGGGSSSSSSGSGQPVRPIRRRVVAPRCPAGQVCCKSRSGTPSSSGTTTASSSTRPTIPREGTCGKRNACGITSTPTARKGDAQVGEYPWMAIILRVNAGRREFLCNAALIDQRTIITVAQCVDGYENAVNQIQVRVGEHNLTATDEPYPHQDHRVESVTIHPQYDNVSLVNDIAVIRLSDEVRNNYHISPICLANESENFSSQSCVVTGWGNRQEILKEFFVDCLNDDQCVERLRSTKLGSNFILDRSFFCAQSTDQSSCLIDGGGALQCRRNDGTYALVGLLSWSVDDYSPDVYVRVQNFGSFIRNSENNSSTTTSRSPRTNVPTFPSTSDATSSTTTTTTTQTSQSTNQVTVEAFEQSQTEGTKRQTETPVVVPVSQQSTTGSQETSASPDQVIEPAKPVPLPPVVPEKQDDNEVAEDKKANSFAWSYSSSS